MLEQPSDREINIAFIVERAKACRRRLGMSQAEFAGAVGTSQPTISRWESGEQLPELLSAVGLIVTLDGLEAATGAGPATSNDPATADTLDEIRHDLGEAVGLLAAVVLLSTGRPPDTSDPIQCVARAALDKIERAFKTATDTLEAQA